MFVRLSLLMIKLRAVLQAKKTAVKINGAN